MKKLLIGLFCLLMASSVFANKVGVTLVKNVNEGYELSLPVNLGAQAQLPFLPKAELETAMVFTAPRGQLQSFNHSRFIARVSGQIVLLGGNLKLSTGLVNYFAGNYENVPEGLSFDNAVEYSYEW